MKGFGIYVKNDLLDPKHFKAMRGSVWLYLWFLDKMTGISEDGVGRVLGGKPIKFEEVEKELGVPRINYVRWVGRLRKSGYIQTKRTPYGMVVSVNKAFKMFKNDTSKRRDVSKGSGDVSKSYMQLRQYNDNTYNDNTREGSIKKYKGIQSFKEIINNLKEG